MSGESYDEGERNAREVARAYGMDPDSPEFSIKFTYPNPNRSYGQAEVVGDMDAWSCPACGALVFAPELHAVRHAVNGETPV